MPKTLKNYYLILEVSRNANFEEIKSSYRRLAKLWHPDKNKSADANERMALIIEAYELLKDSEKRRVYNILYDEVFGFNSLPTEFVEESMREERYYSPKPEHKKLHEDLELWIKDIKERIGDIIIGLNELLEETRDIVSQGCVVIILAIIGIGCGVNVFKYIAGGHDVSILRLVLSSLALSVIIFFGILWLKHGVFDVDDNEQF